MCRAWSTSSRTLARGCSTCRPTSATRRQRGRVVSEVSGTLGTPSALVNNAGRAPRVRADLLEATEESFEELVRTNLQGPYFLTQAVANAMIANRAAARRGIVFITSVSAEMASVNRGDYCVSKAGLSMAAKLFAVRLAPHRHSGLRGPSGHHRHRHDRRREGEIRSAHRRRTDSGCALGHTGRCGQGRWRCCCAVRCRTPPDRCCTSTAA